MFPTGLGTAFPTHSTTGASTCLNSGATFLGTYWMTAVCKPSPWLEFDGRLHCDRLLLATSRPREPPYPTGYARGAPASRPTGIYQAQQLMRLLSTPSPGAVMRSELAQPAARRRMREVQSALVAHPRRGRGIPRLRPVQSSRNHRSFRWYLDSVVTPEGVSPPLLLDQRWAGSRPDNVHLG